MKAVWFKKTLRRTPLITTIDIDIQDVAESALYDHLIEHQAEWGCAVLMEVETGKIKAIANLQHDPKTNKYYESYNYLWLESSC